MTEADYLSLMNDYISTSFTIVGLLLSLMSAFLIASYLVAAEMKLVVASLLVVMYSVAYFWIGGAAIDGNMQILGFVGKMQMSGIDFSWARFNDLTFKIYIANALVVAGYVCSLVFFFYIRSHPSEKQRST